MNAAAVEGPNSEASIAARDPYAADRAWLDAVIAREIRRLRARYELSLDELRGLYVSDRQVDALLRQADGDDASAVDAADARIAALAACRRGETLLRTLATRLRLSRLEREVLFLALAPELDLRYETLYGYLNDDATRRHLTVDLAVRLLAPTPSRDVRAALSTVARLAAVGVIEPLDPPGDRRVTLGGGWLVSPLAAQYLLELPLADARLPATMRFLGQDTLAGELTLLTTGTRAMLEEHVASLAHWPRLTVATGQGSAEQIAALHYAATLHGIAVLLVPLDLARGDNASWLAHQPRLRLMAQLAGATVLLHGDGEDCGAPQATSRMARALRDLIGDGVPVMWATGTDTHWPQCVGELPHEPVVLPEASSDERSLAWRDAARRARITLPPALAGELAQRFVLPVSRIHAAVQSAACRQSSDDDATRLGLWRAAKAQSAQGLASLATRVVSPHGWHQLELPHAIDRTLREFTRAITQRETVYRDWQMATRTGRGTGLVALFAGASGTGKSMAAAVVANTVGLDMFRVDLSSVISKYIGETEKNLDRIFAAARDANALLFFDEADALLGKRSEVKDAHDRYANIEVAYLLQKLEEHHGVVVLATNLAKNLDQAFARRTHYVIEFPRPDAALRERLWRGMFPAAVPLADDLDFAQLAAQFETSGGEIQSIALEAAFLACADGKPIAMAHLLQALTRHQVRQGNPAMAARTRRDLQRPG